MTQFVCDKCGKVIPGPDGCSVKIRLLAYSGRGRTTERCGECARPIYDALGWYRDGYDLLIKKKVSL